MHPAKRGAWGIYCNHMTEKSKKTASAEQKAPTGHPPVTKPDWANGLRRLYDSVVEEPLPDSFMDLLSKLDDTDK